MDDSLSGLPAKYHSLTCKCIGRSITFLSLLASANSGRSRVFYSAFCFSIGLYTGTVFPKVPAKTQKQRNQIENSTLWTEQSFKNSLTIPTEQSRIAPMQRRKWAKWESNRPRCLSFSNPRSAQSARPCPRRRSRSPLRLCSRRLHRPAKRPKCNCRIITTPEPTFT